MNDIQIISTQLSNISLDSKNINDENLNEYIDEYNIIFYGKEQKWILSSELYHYLKNNFSLKMTFQEFNSIIADVCQTLNIRADGQMALDDIANGKKQFCNYIIYL